MCLVNTCVYNLFRTLHQKIRAYRHNLAIHNGGGEIVTLVEYLVGRRSGRYQASHPFWYRRNGKRTHKLGRPTVADYVGDTFPFRSLQQQGQYRHHQQPLEQERYHQSMSPPLSTAIQDQPPERTNGRMSYQDQLVKLSLYTLYHKRLH